MSFANDLKEELIKHFSKKTDSQRAELAALVLLNSDGLTYDAERRTYIYTANIGGANAFTTLRKTFNINGQIDLSKSLDELTDGFDAKRAFIRGAFIAAGVMTDPEKGYHMEFAVPDDAAATFLIETMAAFDIHGRVSARRGRPFVYVKEGVEISDLLNVMEAHKSLMNFENVRIVKEMRGAVNRQVNCETANLSKTVSAGMRQVEDIQLILSIMDPDELDPGILDMCNVRLANPDLPLAELGALLDPPIGKSGVNHRLRKIKEYAATLRGDSNSK